MKMAPLRQTLAEAGFRGELATMYYRASKTLTPLALALVAILICVISDCGILSVLGVSVSTSVVGFMIPNCWLWVARKRRGRRIKNGQPDLLQKLIAYAESGLTIDLGLQRFVDEMRQVYPELSEELEIAILEHQMGVPRAEALESMARRCGIDEVRAWVNAINRAEKFGTPFAKALRNHFENLRSQKP